MISGAPTDRAGLDTTAEAGIGATVSSSIKLAGSSGENIFVSEVLSENEVWTPRNSEMAGRAGEPANFSLEEFRTRLQVAFRIQRRRIKQFKKAGGKFHIVRKKSFAEDSEREQVRRTLAMRSLRNLIERFLFPRWTPGQRRRHMRFLMLGILLGMFIAAAFGAMLYFVNGQSRL